LSKKDIDELKEKQTFPEVQKWYEQSEKKTKQTKVAHWLY